MKKIITFLSIAFVFSCGTSRKKWISKNCTKNGGYELGQKDIQAGRAFNTAFLAKCPLDTLSETRDGYEIAFKAAGVSSNGDGKYGRDPITDVIRAIKGKKKTDSPAASDTEVKDPPKEVKKEAKK